MKWTAMTRVAVKHRQLFRLLLITVFVGWGTLPAVAQLTHAVGRVEWGVAGQGFLASSVTGGQIVPNFAYPRDKSNPRVYLQNYSEVWVGMATGPVASALELQADGRLTLGEWAPAAGGDPQVVPAPPGVHAIRAAYEAKPTSQNPAFPYSVLVEEATYAWEDASLPESNSIVVRLTLTNQGNLPLTGVFVALATNWDVDASAAQPPNQNLDSVEWDANRRASIVFDGDPSDGSEAVQVATVLLEGRLKAVRVLAVPGTPWTFSDVNRVLFLAAPQGPAQSTQPRNHFTILVAGPMELRGKTPATALFALAAGEGRDALLKNVDALKPAVARPANIVAEAVEGGIRLAWEGPISADVAGFALFRSDAPSGPFQQVGPRIISASDFTDTTAAPDVTYYYHVKTVNAQEQVVDAPSDVASAATGPLPPQLADLKASLAGTRDQPIVELRIPEPADTNVAGMKLLLYRNETGREPFTLIQTRDVSTSIADKEVAPGKRYFYAVRLLSKAGRLGDLSAPVEAVVPPVPGTVALDLSTVTVAPVPAHRGKPVRFLNLPAPSTVFVYAATGERVARLDHLAGGELVWTPDADLANGVYVYQVRWNPEAESKDSASAPENTGIRNVFGKLVLLD
jgi:hypothetical protein